MIQVHNFDFRLFPPDEDTLHFILDIASKNKTSDLLCHSLPLIELLLRESRNCGLSRYRMLVNTATSGSLLLVLPDSQREEEYWFYATSLFACEYSPPCTPEDFLSFFPYMPAMCDSILSDEYTERLIKLGVTFRPPDADAHVVCADFPLPDTFEAYLSSLPAKKRENLRRNLRFNANLRVEHGHVPFKDISAVLDSYAGYWEANPQGSMISMPDRLRLDVKIFDTFKEDVHVITVLDDDGTVLAVNYCWCRGSKIVDMLCLRLVEEKYNKMGLGVFCILQNILWAIDNKYTSYSMVEGAQPYKAQFVPVGVQSTEIKELEFYSIIDVNFGRTGGYYKGLYLTEQNIKHVQTVLKADIAEMNSRYSWED